MNELAKSYPDRSRALSEIINLNAILNLPKGTEHFMSDLHAPSVPSKVKLMFFLLAYCWNSSKRTRR